MAELSPQLTLYVKPACWLAELGSEAVNVKLTVEVPLIAGLATVTVGDKESFAMKAS